MQKARMNNLRQASRKLVRELGMLQLNQARKGETPQHWHALIEIAKTPGLTITALGELLLLSPSAASRLVNSLSSADLISTGLAPDKREKTLHITTKGRSEVDHIDDFSNEKIKGAFEFLSDSEQDNIIEAIQLYGIALEKSRHLRDNIKINTLSTSRPLRKSIVGMVEYIQTIEFGVAITDEINACILKAEDTFCFNNTCNFWYATNEQNEIIGCIGLKKIDEQNCEMKKFFVRKDYRGKKVAQKLLSKLLSAAIKHHFDYIYLGTVDILEAAQRFYEKNGFERISKGTLPLTFEICPVDSVFFKAEIKALSNLSR